MIRGFSVDALCQLRHGAQMVLGARPCDAPLESRALLRGHPVTDVAEDAGDIEPRIPGLQIAQRGEVPHRLAVGAHGGLHRSAPRHRRQAELAAGDRDARREPLDIPLPRTACGLVEIVDVEHQLAVGRSETAEVRQVRITAQLDRRARPRRLGEVGGHQSGSAAEEGERRRQHPPVPNWHQLGHAIRGLVQQHGLWAPAVA